MPKQHGSLLMPQVTPPAGPSQEKTNQESKRDPVARHEKPMVSLVLPFDKPWDNDSHPSKFVLFFSSFI